MFSTLPSSAFLVKHYFGNFFDKEIIAALKTNNL